LADLNVNINNFNIRYNEYGKSQAPKHLLFLHGLGSSSDRWGDIPEALSRYFHSISVDLIGFGGSDRPNLNYSIDKFREFVLDFMHAIKIDDGKTTIIGHSLGGYIAAELAIENPNMIESLVLIDSSGMLDKPTLLLQQYLDAAISASYEKLKAVFEQLAAQRWRVFPTLVDVFIKRINMPGAKHAFESAFHNSTKTQIGLDRLRKLQDVRTLIIWGRCDNLIPLKYSKPFTETIRNAYFEIIEDAGHAPFAEKPAIVCEILREFLSQDSH
jgi:2-hydroxy-6-oxonona-2,4-dienedioate hydrolase